MLFFIAISRIKKVRRLIWYLTCFYLNSNRYWKRNLKYVEVVFQFQILMSSSQLSQDLSKLWVCKLHFTFKKNQGDKKEKVNQVNQINQETKLSWTNRPTQSTIVAKPVLSLAQLCPSLFTVNMKHPVFERLVFELKRHWIKCSDTFYARNFLIYPRNSV